MKCLLCQNETQRDWQDVCFNHQLDTVFNLACADDGILDLHIGLRAFNGLLNIGIVRAVTAFSAPDEVLSVKPSPYLGEHHVYRKSLGCKSISEIRRATSDMSRDSLGNRRLSMLVTAVSDAGEF